MAQTTYTRYNATVGLPGQLSDSGYSYKKSFLNDQGADVPAGVFMSHKADGTADLPAGATEQLAGVSILSYHRDPNDLTGTSAVKAGAEFNALQEGAIWVRCEEAMAINDPVYIRYAAGTGTQLGAVRNDADSTTARLCKGARVITPSSGAGVVELYVSIAADRAAL